MSNFRPNSSEAHKKRSLRLQMSDFSLEPKCIFLGTNQEIFECCRLISSNANALADLQQAFHGLLGGPWTSGWEPLIYFQVCKLLHAKRRNLSTLAAAFLGSNAYA